MPTDTTLLVISTCKFIEAFASSALASLLDIDRENSKTLSNKTSALSFKQKLDFFEQDVHYTEHYLQFLLTKSSNIPSGHSHVGKFTLSAKHLSH